jgi:hypothetical protein
MALGGERFPNEVTLTSAKYGLASLRTANPKMYFLPNEPNK